MRYAKAQRIIVGYSPWLNHYPCWVALQQSSIPFSDKHNEIKFDYVYLQPVLIMGGLRIQSSDFNNKDFANARIDIVHLILADLKLTNKWELLLPN